MTLTPEESLATTGLLNPGAAVTTFLFTPLQRRSWRICRGDAMSGASRSESISRRDSWESTFSPSCEWASEVSVVLSTTVLRGVARACVPINNPKSTHESLRAGNRPQLKPIPTRYDGYHFRSRTEARYAVLFRNCYWPYEYERQGFALERGAYLPDIYLLQQGVWVEVKGPPPRFEEEDLCQCLAVETRQPVIIAWGQPSWETVVICFTPDGDRQLISLAGFLLRWASVSTLTKAINAARSARWEHGEKPKIPELSAANTP
jgi:hypothetical protein